MCTAYFHRVLLLSIYLQYCATSLLFSGQSNISSAHLILDDIHRAFADIINNTSDIKKLIPKMYGFNVTNSPVIFKVPIQDGAAIIFMQRSDFVSPQFPNLTKSYVELMQERRHFLQNIPKENLNDNQEKSTANDWDKLGLKGWIGEISGPTQYLLSNKNSRVQYSVYASEVLRDIKLKEILNKISSANTAHKTITSQNKLVSDKISMAKNVDITRNNQDSNVFIARVNDPFGFSSSWELRSSSLRGYINSTSLEMEDNRLKRDVVKLYSMIKCSTGCDPLIFKGYGCYCGFLGAGIPVDGIDRCCKLHDKCYEYSNCISYLEYFVPYIWKCYRGKPLCAIDHGEFGGPQSCAARLCNCDLRLSLCLRQFACPRRRASCRSSAARQLQNLIFY